MRRTLESNISTPRRRDGLARHLGRTAYFTAQSSAPQLRLRRKCAAFRHDREREREREPALARSAPSGRGGVRIGGTVRPFRLLGGGPGAGQLLTRTGGPSPRRQRLGARAGRRWCSLRVCRPGVPSAGLVSQAGKNRTEGPTHAAAGDSDARRIDAGAAAAGRAPSLSSVSASESDEVRPHRHQAARAKLSG